MSQQKCKPCYYYGGNTKSCDLYLVTGIRNTYEPENCPYFKEGKRRGKLPPDFVKSAAYLKNKNTERNGYFTSMEVLYYEGKNDKEIAEDLGCTPGSVAKWRARHCLPSQKEIERMRKIGKG